jgi:hypothetical protein
VTLSRGRIALGMAIIAAAAAGYLAFAPSDAKVNNHRVSCDPSLLYAFPGDPVGMTPEASARFAACYDRAMPRVIAAFPTGAVAIAGAVYWLTKRTLTSAT